MLAHAKHAIFCAVDVRLEKHTEHRRVRNLNGQTDSCSEQRIQQRKDISKVEESQVGEARGIRIDAEFVGVFFI